MKGWYIILLLTLFGLQSEAQEKKRPFFFNECSLSMNRSDLLNENTRNRSGFGCGLYHSGLSNRKINPVLGFEFNLTRQFKKVVNNGPSSHFTDVTYRINTWSIPLGIRSYFGSESRLFTQGGVFIDFALGGQKRGTLNSWHADSLNRVVYEASAFKSGADINSPIYGLFVGVGAAVPMKHFDLLIKSDYKLGLKALNDDLNTRYFSVSLGLKKKKRLPGKE